MTKRSLLLATTLALGIALLSPAAGRAQATQISGEHGWPTLSILDRNGHATQVRGFAIREIRVMCSVNGSKAHPFPLSIVIRRSFDVAPLTGRFLGTETTSSDELNGVGRNASRTVTTVKGSVGDGGSSATGVIKVRTHGVQLVPGGRVVSNCTSRWLPWSASA